MDSVFGLQGKDFVIVAADCSAVRSILKFKVSIYISNNFSFILYFFFPVFMIFHCKKKRMMRTK